MKVTDRRAPRRELSPEEVRIAEERARMALLLDDETAVVDRRTFEALPTYSATLPTGAFVGKLWKRREPERTDLPATWWLGEYAAHPSDASKVLIVWRLLLVAE